MPLNLWNDNFLLIVVFEDLMGVLAALVRLYLPDLALGDAAHLLQLLFSL